MFIVEGNIGVGKSTFLQAINSINDKIQVIPEPKENWTTEEYGKSLLKNFYNDIGRWAYTLETLTLMCRIKSHLEMQKNPSQFKLVERSIYSGYFCFAKNGFASGNLTEIEWKIYNSWVSFLFKKCEKPQGFIYLKAKPEICFERVKKRNRESEKTLTLDYLKQIDFWHDKFLIEKEEIPAEIKTIPVLTLDWNKDKTFTKSENENLANKIYSFFLEALDMKPVKNDLNNVIEIL